MKTDISIYDFLALGPEAFRILTHGRTLEGAYAFRSLTFKNIERRLDGLYEPIDHDGPIRERLSALLKYWFMERFRHYSIEEIRQMFQIQTPLQETRAYQDIFAEGEQKGLLEGKLEGKLDSLKHLLTRRFGTLPDWAQQQLAQADHHQLDTWLDRLFEATSLEQLLHHD